MLLPGEGGGGGGLGFPVLLCKLLPGVVVVVAWVSPSSYVSYCHATAR